MTLTRKDKLHLNRETVRELADHGLAGAAGGAFTVLNMSCPIITCLVDTCGPLMTRTLGNICC